MVKALFLDRDGIIIKDKGYPHTKNDLIYVDGIFDLVAKFVSLNYKIIIVTNQSGIGRGYFSYSDFDKFMTAIINTFKEFNIEIASVYFCPHHPVHANPPYNINCDCRKPKPGMLLQAANDHDIDLNKSIIIGDSKRDIEAGIAAGLKKVILVNSENKVNQEIPNIDFMFFEDLRHMLADYF